MTSMRCSSRRVFQGRFVRCCEYPADAENMLSTTYRLGACSVVVAIATLCCIAAVEGALQMGNVFPDGVVLSTENFDGETCEEGALTYVQDDLLVCTSGGWFRIREAVEMLNFALSPEGGGGGISPTLLQSIRYCNGNGNYTVAGNGDGSCACYDTSFLGHWGGEHCSQCRAGWAGSDCRRDEDECANEGRGNDCHENAVCTNTPGSWDCECADGYSGNGTSCEDIDECATNNGGCHDICVNEDGTFHCECGEGYEVDPVDSFACINIDECSTGTHNCDQFADCVDTDGSFECTCHPLYLGDGVSCDLHTGVSSSSLLSYPCLGGSYDQRIPGFQYSTKTCEQLLSDYSFGDDDEQGNFVTDPDICGDADKPGGCYPSATWSAAKSKCESFGARLCTSDEYSVGEPEGTSCSYDTARVWTATSCGPNSHITQAGDPGNLDSIPIQCTSDSVSHVHRCCGDSINRLVCKVCPQGSYCPTHNDSLVLSCPENTSSDFASKRLTDCTCLPGFEGNDGEACTDIDECAGFGGGNDCHEKAVCANTAPFFTCSCVTGYSGSGTSCSPVCGDGLKTDGEACDDGNTDSGDGCSDDCMTIEAGHWCDLQSSSDESLQLSICRECQAGTFNNETGRESPCTVCPAGFDCTDASLTPSPCASGTYSLEGVAECESCPVDHYCPDVDQGPVECPGGLQAPLNSVDVNACNCPAGFALFNSSTGEVVNVEDAGDFSEVVCGDADECNNHGGTHNCDTNAVCENSAGSFTCTCLPEYIGDGVSCEHYSGATTALTRPCTATGLMDPLTVAPESFSSSSCSQLGFDNRGPDPLVCGDADHNSVCYGQGSYSSALQLCTSFGARLCTAQEVTDDEAEGTGCSYDNHRIWTSTPCGTNSHISQAGDSGNLDTIPPLCSSNSESFSIRCCADALEQIECEACPVGSYCPSVGVREDCPTGSTSLFASKDILDCFCDIGYSGPNGGPCVDDDECAGEGSGHNCDVKASCANTAPGFTCTCQNGYSGDGTSCASVCGDGLKTEGEACDDGNTANGDGCSADCSTIEAGHWCDLQASTDENLRISLCTPCETGTYNPFTGRQETCDDCPAGFSCLDPAASPVPCAPGSYSLTGEADCHQCPTDHYCPTTDAQPISCPASSVSAAESVGLEACACASGHALYNSSSGSFLPGAQPSDLSSFANVQCVDYDECLGEISTHNCDSNAECTNTDGSFECACNAGYIGDGLSCVDAAAYSGSLDRPCSTPGLYDPIAANDPSLSALSCNTIGLQDNGRGDPAVCGDSDHAGSCYGTGTFSQADSLCKSFGARLCTQEEADNNEMEGTGCSVDGKRMWTSTECGGSSHYSQAGDTVQLGNFPLQCTSDSTSSVSIRCCADHHDQVQCRVCPAGSYCPDTSTIFACPGGTTSPLASTHSSHCV